MLAPRPVRLNRSLNTSECLRAATRHYDLPHALIKQVSAAFITAVYAPDGVLVSCAPQ